MLLGEMIAHIASSSSGTENGSSPGTIVVHWLWRFGCALYFIRGLCFQDQLELLIQNDVEKISADAALFILKHQIFGLLKSMQFDIQQTAWLLWINKQFTDG